MEQEKITWGLPLTPPLALGLPYRLGPLQLLVAAQRPKMYQRRRNHVSLRRVWRTLDEPFQHSPSVGSDSG